MDAPALTSTSATARTAEPTGSPTAASTTAPTSAPTPLVALTTLSEEGAVKTIVGGNGFGSKKLFHAS